MTNADSSVSFPSHAATPTHTVTDNLDELLAILPPGLAASIAPEARADLVEIVLDLGRRPEARFNGNRYEYLREQPIVREELHFVEERLGAFGGDNRAGIAATLHRISAMRNRRGEIVGLTLRVGRAVVGIVDILRDLIDSGQSLLLMGRPGLGKTTLLREMARVLADEGGKRVVVVDTSNEIAGDGDVPHPAIGRARRMQVAQVFQQHDVMIEAVENHMPEVIVIDEIGRVEEALAARTIAERGVQLVATVHGNTLENLLANPSLGDLVGGIAAVTLSDDEARRRGTQKTVLERKAPPTFDVVVEMIERDKIAVRAPVADVVDALLRGLEAPPEIRFRNDNGEIQIELAPELEPAPHDFEMRAASPSRAPGARSGARDERGDYRRGEKRGASTRERGAARRESSGRDNAAREMSSRDAPANARERRDARRIAERYGDDHLFLEDHRAPEMRALPERESAAREYSQNDEVLLDIEENFVAPRDENAAPIEVVHTTAATFSARELQQSRQRDDRAGDDEKSPRVMPDAPLDVSRVRHLYPFGVSRSRLTRAIKQLGLPLCVARTWREADGVLMLTGAEGVPLDSTLLQAPREMGLPVIGVEGNTYAQVLSRLNELYGGGDAETKSPREAAMSEAKNAAQRVLAQAESVELRPQDKALRRAQHQLAEKFHLRSYSVGREPNRRVRFLPGSRQRAR